MNFSIFKNYGFGKKPLILPWYRQITHYYFLIQVCLALEKIGFFDLLSPGKILKVDELSKKLGVEENFLNICVEFLWSVTDILGKDKNGYFLKTPNFSKALWVMQAYKPVFENLDNILLGKKKYGRDITRDGYYLQKASDLFSGDAIDKVLNVLKSEKDGILIDFGCGSAKSLIFYCKENSGRRGLGVDIDSSIIKEAELHIKDAGLKEMALVVESDVFNIEKWQREIPGGAPIIFLASTMLHEFLREGEGFVVDFLREIKVNFPDSRFFIIEFDAIPFEKIKYETDMNRKLFAAMYELWHPLTNQGMPQPQEVWERIIRNAGWKLQNIIKANNYLLIYDCRL